jgi:iron complex outermembrane receptor protein
MTRGNFIPDEQSDSGPRARAIRKTALAATVSVSLVFGAAAARAQSLDYSSLEALFGEPVTTSVTGSPQRASEVPASMLIISAEQIRRSGARDIPGILSHYAGIDVDRTSNEYADVAVRGYNQAFNPRLLVLVDGRQVYADYYGFTPWSTIPVELEAIRQIEVVKGPSGALFGFNAAGGVVNIVTLDPLTDPSRSQLSLSAGTQDLEQVSAVSLMKFGSNAALRISAGAKRSGEFSTPRQPADIATGDENRRNAFSADGHIMLGPRLEFGVELTYSDSQQYEFAPTYSITFGEYETNSIRTHWQADTRFGLVSANLYRNQIEADAYLDTSAAPARQFDNDVLVAQLENVFKVGTAHVLRIAGEYRRNSMETTPISGAEIQYDVSALTAMWHWDIASNLSLSNSIRVDRWDLGRSGFLPPAYVTDFGLTNEIWDISRDESSFNSGLVWEISDYDSLRFSSGRARQLPNLLSLGGDFSEFFGFFLLGNPWLEPTNVSSSEINWRRRFPESDLSFDLGLFRGYTEDVQSAQFGNLGNSRTNGIEARIEGSAGERWGWDLGLRLQEVDDELSPLFTPDITFVDFENTTPERTITGHVAWTHGQWEVDAYVRYDSASVGIRGPGPGDFTGSFIEIPGHIRLDARLAYEISPRWRASISGRSLTRPSQRQTGAPEVERQIFATLDYEF